LANQSTKRANFKAHLRLTQKGVLIASIRSRLTAPGRAAGRLRNETSAETRRGDYRRRDMIAGFRLSGLAFAGRRLSEWRIIA